jgi:hypothetical protein
MENFNFEIIRVNTRSDYNKLIQKYRNEYNTYNGMRQRCLNPNDHNYKRYGKRGITICERWLGENGFKYFLEDMGERPSENYSLDRIDNNKEYSPENCRWANREEQANNRRDNRHITFLNKTQTVSQWAREYNLRPDVVIARLYIGWTIEEALGIKERNINRNEVYNIKKFKLNDKFYTIKQLSEMYNINYDTLNYRLRYSNWTVEEAVGIKQRPIDKYNNRTIKKYKVGNYNLTLKEITKKYNIKYSILINRKIRYKNLTIEEILVKHFNINLT